MNFGLIHTYTSFSVTSGDYSDSDSQWEWIDGEDLKEMFSQEDADLIWVPLVCLFILIGLLVVAMVLGLMKESHDSIMVIIALAITVVSAFAGIYFAIRWSTLMTDEMDQSFISLENEEGFRTWTGPGLGWLVTTIITPILGVKMALSAHSGYGFMRTPKSLRSTNSSGFTKFPDGLKKNLPETHLGFESQRPLFGVGGQLSENEEEDYSDAEYAQSPQANGMTASDSELPVFPQVSEPEYGSQPSPAPPPPPPPSSSDSVPASVPLDGEMATIACPSCSHQFKVPATGGLQAITCPACGLSGDVEV